MGAPSTAIPSHAIGYQWASLTAPPSGRPARAFIVEDDGTGFASGSITLASDGTTITIGLTCGVLYPIAVTSASFGKGVLYLW